MNVFRLFNVLALALLTGCLASPGAEDRATATGTLRVATFNTALSRPSAGELAEAMARGDDAKVKLVAETIQRTRPDIVLLQEVDHDPSGQTYADFQRNYLAISHNGSEPIDYPYVYAPPVNTGEPSGVDLDGDGKLNGPGDALGWGNYPGHFGMVVLSKYPIDTESVRTFRELRWQRFAPNHLDAIGLYSDEARQVLRLSSKTHADVVVQIDGRPLHLLISHPTPPVFDGPEDRNGYRNHDELMLWYTYLTWTNRDAILTDDQGRRGALPREARFVLLGDMNADPLDGASRDRPMWKLLSHPRINTARTPGSIGGIEASMSQRGANQSHLGIERDDTTDWEDGPADPGNLRVDYALPSDNLFFIDAGVFWPMRAEPLHYLTAASDHRLVWVDVSFEKPRAPVTEYP